MTTTSFTIVAIAWLSGVAAFSSTPFSKKLSLSSFTAPGIPRSIASHSRGTSSHRLPHSISHRQQYPAFKSSLRESLDTEARSNETLIDQQIHSDDGASSASAAADTDSPISSTPQQQIQEVLSSPELLDPAAILDATIGINEDSDVSFTSQSDTAADDDDDNVAISNAETKQGATSKEEDLELTLQTILNHIDEETSGVSSSQSSSKQSSGSSSQPSGAPSSTINGGVVEEEEGKDGDLQDEPAILQNNFEEEPATLQSTSTTTKLVGNTISILDCTPSTAKILRYTIPAIGIWLCSPVLSMIDTAAVGLLSGTAQQAALNPAVSVTDYGALVVAFMYTATTNLIAAAVQEDKDDNAAIEQPKTTTTLITALKLALAVGSVFGIILGTSGKTLLKLLIGNDSLDPAVFSAALKYVSIRSLGIPAMVVIGTAQSACLGMQDVKSPLYVLFAAAIVNFLGDVLMVPSKSPMFGGAAGAAWATVASQYAALLFFSRWLTTSPNSNANNGAGLRSKIGGIISKLGKNTTGKGSLEDDVALNSNTKVVNVTQGIMELTGTTKEGRSRRKEFRKFLTSSKLSRKIWLASNQYPSAAMTVDTASANEQVNTIRPEVQKKKEHPKTRGFFANGKFSLSKYLSFSNGNFNVAKAKEFLPFVVPVTTTSVGRISGYIAMSHVASSTLGTYDMAGHQIIFSIFCCLTPFVDALGQVAQSFVPAVFEAKDKSKERAMALRQTVNNFRKVGAGFGCLLLGLVTGIPLISRFFTTDPIVMQRVNSALPGLGMFLFLHGLTCAGEGKYIIYYIDLSMLLYYIVLHLLTPLWCVSSSVPRHHARTERSEVSSQHVCNFLLYSARLHAAVETQSTDRSSDSWYWYHVGSICHV